MTGNPCAIRISGHRWAPGEGLEPSTFGLTDRHHETATRPESLALQGFRRQHAHRTVSLCRLCAPARELPIGASRYNCRGLSFPGSDGLVA